MLLPRFTIRWILGLTTVCAVFALLMTYAIRGNLVLAALSIAIGSLVVVMAVHALLFLVLWALSFLFFPPSSQAEKDTGQSPLADARLGRGGQQ